MSKKTTISMKANPATDADIIAWWESLPAGERSAALRQVIRAAMCSGSPKQNGNGHLPEMVQVAADTAWLRAALMELPTYLEGLFSRASVMRLEAQPVTVDAQSAEQPKLDQSAVDRRRANVKRSTW